MTQEMAYTVDGQSSSQFWDGIAPERPISRALARMNGGAAFAFSIWPVPTDIDWRDLDLTIWPREYIQSAGAADAMTVEIRRLEDGEPRQYAVGRGGPRASEPDQVIPFGVNGRTVSVFADEVFDADEATRIYLHYYETQSIPAQYVLRLLDLAWPPEEQPA